MCLADADFTYRVTEAKKGMCLVAVELEEEGQIPQLFHAALRAGDQKRCWLVDVWGYLLTTQLTNASYNAIIRSPLSVVGLEVTLQCNVGLYTGWQTIYHVFYFLYSDVGPCWLVKS